MKYSEQWAAMSSSERIKMPDYISERFEHYRSLGFEVSDFRSATVVSYKGETIYSSNEMVGHFTGCIDFMENYIKNIG